MKIDKITTREDLYPRLEIDTKKIQEYSENIEKLPPIEINQDNILVDGLHRIKAHKQAERDEIEYTIFNTKSDNDIMMRAIELNATHGLQLDYKSKKSLAIKLYVDDESRKRLIKALSVSVDTFDVWTKNKKKQLDEERNQKILDLHLQCWTQQRIANELEVTKKTISAILSKLCKNPKILKITQMTDFEPKSYNIWSYGKQESADTKVFGTLPQGIVEQLIYYYTEPFDVVYDPFEGAGITVDACKKWYRRYYVSDMNPTEIAKTKNTKQWKIQDGIPNELPKPKLVFLDPPYWEQAKGKYSKDSDDLANMPIDDFYSTLKIFFGLLKKKMGEGGHIAVIMGMTQSDGVVKDHAFELYALLEDKKFEFVQRINIPYSTQQVSDATRESALKGRYMLRGYRELLIFKKVKK